MEWFNKSKYYPKRAIDNYVILEWIGDTLNELYRFNKAIKAFNEAIDIVNENYEHTINFHKGTKNIIRLQIPYLKSLLDEKNERISGLKNRVNYSNS